MTHNLSLESNKHFVVKRTINTKLYENLSGNLNAKREKMGVANHSIENISQ